MVLQQGKFQTNQIKIINNAIEMEKKQAIRSDFFFYYLHQMKSNGIIKLICCKHRLNGQTHVHQYKLK